MYWRIYIVYIRKINIFQKSSSTIFFLGFAKGSLLPDTDVDSDQGEGVSGASEVAGPSKESKKRKDTTKPPAASKKDKKGQEAEEAAQESPKADQSGKRSRKACA